jgi:ABC-type polysaccharide/polyol phosphate export permease
MGIYLDCGPSAALNFRCLMRALYARIAIRDVLNSFRHFSLAAFLAWEDIRQRYVRTTLGPFWIVLSTGVWISVLGYVMANLFHQDMQTYFPFLVSGVLVWLLISGCMAESSMILLTAATLITSFPIPIFTHFIRFILRNLIIFLHNIVILVIVLLIFPPHLTSATWLVIPGLLLDIILLLGLAVCLALTNLRYRDTYLAVASAMQILPFITPVFWDRGMLKENKWIADINPFSHMIAIVREPLLGNAPPAFTWMITAGMAFTLCCAACLLFVRFRHRIIFWL